VLNDIGLLNKPIIKEVSFFAGKAFLRYGQNGGIKNFRLPDFFIGAHASHSNYSLPTRDKHRFLNYFPEIKLISPSN
jgi:predicted nucleic acid-binding protein